MADVSKGVVSQIQQLVQIGFVGVRQCDNLNKKQEFPELFS